MPGVSGQTPACRGEAASHSQRPRSTEDQVPAGWADTLPLSANLTFPL